jgi:type IV pilus assembly protein PilO
VKLEARISPRRAPLALLATVAAAALLDWRWLAGDRWAELIERRARLAERRIALQAARREALSLARTKRSVHDAARALRQAEERLPEERELGAVLAEVATIARAAGLELLLLRPKPDRQAGDHAEVPLEMQVRGTFNETIGFLARIERLGRLVRVRGVRFDRPEQAGARTVLRVTCDASTFRFLGGGRGATTRGAHG